MLAYRLRDFLLPGEWCHIAVSTLRLTRPQLHTHDFQELFWVEEGKGWHWINGRQLELRPGVLVLVRAEDRHGFSTRPGEAVRILNIAFSRAIWEAMRRRYRLGRKDSFAMAPQERHHAMGGVAYGALREAAEELLAGGRDRLAVDRFLMNLLHLLRHERQGPADEAMPAWLACACREISHPRQLRQGVAAFVELAGRSPEHVARAARRFLGKTPTQLVNEARMAHAARRLAQSSIAVAEVAEECGVMNLSHFHVLFRGRFGLTPRAYRRRQQLIPGAGETRV